MNPDDLDRFSTLSDPRVHPDGHRVAFMVSRMSLEEDTYERRVWVFDGEEARPFTAGPVDTAPRWSPDGATLAFLRSEGKESPSQVHVMPADGGEARRLTEFALSATEIEWSPDGTRLAVVAEDWVSDWADLDDDERKRRPRRITRLPWRADDAGWKHDRRSNIYLLDPAGDGDPVLISGDDYDDGSVCWHPDGSRIAFLSARHETRSLDEGDQAWEISVEGGSLRPLVEVGRWMHVSYRPDGVVHLVGVEDRWDYPSVPSVFRIEGDGTLTNLTGHVDRSPLPFAPLPAPEGPQWVGESFFSVLEDEGRVRVIWVGPEGDVDDVIGGDRVISGVSPRSDGEGCAFVASGPTDPGELFWWEDGEERVLTTINEDFRSSARLVEPSPFRFENDGVPLQGWAYLPEGSGQAPLLLNIHGGPATQYDYGFFDEFQVYAGAGYGVVACNPRGSSGWGRDFVRAPVGEWQKEAPLDMRDLLACVDAALEQFPRLDPKRRGVMGGSYGGFATIRLLALDQRFSSGVVERCLSSFLSFAGTSDIATTFDRYYVGEPLPGGFDALAKASPMAYAHDITTPTLIIHSETDFRTPIEQGEQVFVLLQRLGVRSEMVRFPDESHELSRSGKPRHRRERFEAILEWHEANLAHAPD